MKHRTVVSLFLICSFVSQIIYADEVPSTPPPPTQISPSYLSPLKLGEPAPFDGLLLSESAAAEIIADRKLFPEKIIIETNKVRDSERNNCKLQLGEAKTTCDQTRAIDIAKIQEKDSEVQALNKKIGDLDKQILEQGNTEKNLPKYAAVGFLTGIATTLLTVYAISSITH